MRRNNTPLVPILDKFMALKPSTYQFRGAHDVKPILGFLAQQIKPYFPELVSEKNGLLAVSYQKVGVLAVKAIQEQQAHIKSLESRILKLENKIANQ